MKRYFDLNKLTDNNYCDDLEPNWVEIPDDGKPYGLVDGEVIDISDMPEYIAEQKKILIQAAKITRDTAINEITNAKLLDDLQHDSGQITDTIYNTRKATRLAQLAEVQAAFYTATGLAQPTIITA